jgi:hypothetical protein
MGVMKCAERAALLLAAWDEPWASQRTIMDVEAAPAAVWSLFAGAMLPRGLSAVAIDFALVLADG